MKTVVIIVIAAALALGGCVPPTTHVGTQDLNHDRAIVEERTSGAEVLIDDDFRRKAAAKVQAEAKRVCGVHGRIPQYISTTEACPHSVCDWLFGCTTIYQCKKHLYACVEQ